MQGANHMGSVGDDYRCPWCGRTGNVGYAPEDVGYPICTNGSHSCLWTARNERGFGLLEFRQVQLETILIIGHRADVPGRAARRLTTTQLMKRVALGIVLPLVVDMLWSSGHERSRSPSATPEGGHGVM